MGADEKNKEEKKEITIKFGDRIYYALRFLCSCGIVQINDLSIVYERKLRSDFVNNIHLLIPLLD